MIEIVVYLLASLRHMGMLVWGLYFLTYVTTFVLYFVLYRRTFVVKDVSYLPVIVSSKKKNTHPGFIVQPHNSLFLLMFLNGDQNIYISAGHERTAKVWFGYSSHFIIRNASDSK